ncbi:hypothetical protein N9K45_00305 [bacterium]|jgi:serine/threonine protein kinase|nr:hypothetical protein [bacterium]
MQKYRLVAKKGEGTFSEVLKAQSVKTNRFTAIKCMKNRFDSIDQVRVKAHDMYTRACTRARAVSALSNRGHSHMSGARSII